MSVGNQLLTIGVLFFFFFFFPPKFFCNIGQNMSKFYRFLKKVHTHTHTNILKNSFHFWLNNQIWLDFLLDNCHLSYITKIGKKKKEKKKKKGYLHIKSLHAIDTFNMSKAVLKHTRYHLDEF
jgi:hypothetical protein